MKTVPKTYTQDWHNEPAARLKQLQQFVARPVRALEIGCFEGRSTCWLMDRVLTHPDARLDAVDPYGYGGGDSEEQREAAAYRSLRSAKIFATFMANTEEYGPRVRHWKMRSDDFFRIAQPGVYQIAIVDGGHAAMQALRDMLHAWQALAAGGVMVIDDIEWKGYAGFESNGPKRAYEAFLSCLPPADHRILYRAYIAIVEKLR